MRELYVQVVVVVRKRDRTLQVRAVSLTCCCLLFNIKGVSRVIKHALATRAQREPYGRVSFRIFGGSCDCFALVVDFLISRGDELGCRDKEGFVEIQYATRHERISTYVRVLLTTVAVAPQEMNRESWKKREMEDTKRIAL